MEQSRVMQNADFLRELSHAHHNRQEVLITTANRRQIAAISDVVRHLLNYDIPVLSHDRSDFRHHRLVMRHLFSTRITTARKKEMLLIHRSLVPRLLRDYYLARILILTFRAREM